MAFGPQSGALFSILSDTVSVWTEVDTQGIAELAADLQRQRAGLASLDSLLEPLLYSSSLLDPGLPSGTSAGVASSWD